LAKEISFFAPIVVALYERRFWRSQTARYSPNKVGMGYAKLFFKSPKGASDDASAGLKFRGDRKA
jgi:hypothetical protein